MKGEGAGRVTVIVPTWNSRRWVSGCFGALEDQTYRDFSVLVVDNGSTDGTVADLNERFGDVEVLCLGSNLGFAGAVSEAIRRVESPLVALLNVDTRAREGWLQALVSCLDEAGPHVAGVSSKLLQLDHPELVDDAGDVLSWYGSALKRGHGEPAEAYEERREVLSVSGAASLFRNEFLTAVGFDPMFESYLEDVDLCLRGQLLGYRFLYEPRAEVLHCGGGSALARGRYVTLMTANRLLTLLKSIPIQLLLRHWRRLLWGQLYFAVAYRKPFCSLRGYMRFFLLIPHVLSQRRILAGKRTRDLDEIDALLTRELGEPLLRDLARRRWRRWRGRIASRESG